MKAVLVNEDNEYIKDLTPVPINISYDQSMADIWYFDSHDDYSFSEEPLPDEKVTTEPVEIRWLISKYRKERALFFKDEALHSRVLRRFG